MAEAMFKKYLSEREQYGITVTSRGLAAIGGEPASPYAVQVMREYGCDISSHHSLPLTESELTADLFVCMTEAHAAMLESCGIAPQQILVMNIPDPYGGTLDDYRICAAKIKAGMDSVYELVS